MKILQFLFIWAACPIMMYGQRIDYKRIILPDGAVNSFEERLVQLAWKNHPSSQIANDEYLISIEEFKIQKAQWSTRLGVSGNLNEFNLKAFTNANEDNGNLFFPRYNFYLNFPLSSLVESPHKKRAARSKVRISENHVNMLKLEMRLTVLKLYSEYKTAELILRIKQQSIADEESNYLLIEQKYKNGDADVENYIMAQRSRNDVKIQLVEAENDFQISKLNLEQIIGMRLEDVQ
jgi:outer membrane protein TolC